MANHLTPLEVCKALIGSLEVIGALVGVDPKAPYQWRYQRGRRGAGDLPYASHQRALLAHSAARGLGLTADHLIWGATEDEVQAILHSRPPAAPFQHRVAAE